MENDDFLKFVVDPSFYTDPVKIEKMKQEIVDRENAKKLLIQQEELRVNRLSCPCCKSTEKSNFIEREHNGIYGSGGKSWIKQEYIICLSCGVHYTDLNKEK